MEDPGVLEDPERYGLVVAATLHLAHRFVHVDPEETESAPGDVDIEAYYRPSCGDAVEYRVQLDIAHCRKQKCWDRAMASLGYVPGPKLLKMRADKRKRAVDRG